MTIEAEELKNAFWDARIELTEQEENELRIQLQQFFLQAKNFKSLNLDRVSATFYAAKRQNILRDDVALPSLPLKTSLKNAPDADDSCFHVPRIIEE